MPSDGRRDDSGAHVRLRFDAEDVCIGGGEGDGESSNRARKLIECARSQLRRLALKEGDGGRLKNNTGQSPDARDEERSIDFDARRKSSDTCARRYCVARQISDHVRRARD